MSIDNLIKTAIEMRSKAIASYSQYKVGAAVETRTGEIIGGCNIENSSYSLTCCAERVALFRAIAEGFTKFKALSVSTQNAGMPCGACRQVIWELCGNIPVYICDDTGLIDTIDAEELLPYPFDKTKLQ
jgi:cytidine deaminase|tara:strand:+ start:1879 stop:2265 length:387 start_codon:yes stop_codon:yes gene_type:complete